MQSLDAIKNAQKWNLYVHFINILPTVQVNKLLSYHLTMAVAQLFRPLAPQAEG